MDDPNRIPRVRISESDFPAKIPGDIDESFLEVVNQKGETIALFFLFMSFEKTDFQDGQEFAKYYDAINIGRDCRTAWQFPEYLLNDLMEKYGVTDREGIFEEGLIADYINEYYYTGEYSNHILICYGRLRYPYGLEESYRLGYRDLLDELFSDSSCYEEFIDTCFEYIDDAVDILKFYLALFNERKSNKNYERIFLSLMNLDIMVFGQVADILITKENIDLFIDAANTVKKTITLAFLLDYKNKHFPADEGNSLELAI